MIQASFTTGAKLAGSQWSDYSTGSDWIFVSDMGELCLSKREVYPSTFAFVDGSVLYAGYGDSMLAMQILNKERADLTENIFYDDEFLIVAADLNAGSVKVQRDAYMTLPLMYAYEAGTVYLSNLYEWVARHVKTKTISRLALADGLVVLPFNWRDTINEIRVLTERSRLNVTTGGASVDLPRKRQKSLQADPHEFKRVLEATLDHYWQRFGGQMMTYELSGGLDSAIAPGYFSRKYQHKPYCVTKLFPFDFYDSQSAKIEDFSQRFGADCATVDINIDRHYPLRYVLEGDYAAPIYRFSEIYRDINIELVEQARSAGASAVFTGIGGNELFERGMWAQQTFAGEAERRRRQEIKPAAFYTEKFLALYADSIDDVPDIGIPAPLCASSALHAGMARNNLYLEKGIWPVSPLANPRLYAYTQGLKPRYKDNKNIMRAYAAAAGYPESIYQPTVNEHAGMLFDQGVLTHFPDKTLPIFQHSRLAEAGFIDLDAAASTYEKVRNKELPARALFDIYNLVTLEHNLQVMQPKLEV